MPSDTAPARICGARRCHGRGICQSPPLKGRWRCKFHGGASTGARTPEGQARVTAAMVAGRARWVERMRRAIAEGWIEKFPGGRRKGRKPRAKTGDRLVNKALRQVDERIEELPPVSDKPFAELTPHEQMIANMKTALARFNEILQIPLTPQDPRMVRNVRDAAQFLVALVMKVDPEALRPQKPGRMLAILEELRAAQKANAERAERGVS
jgi:hypothetical protein